MVQLFEQSASQQSLVERLLRDKDVPSATWLSGQLQQTTYMAPNYRHISGRSSSKCLPTRHVMQVLSSVCPSVRPPVLTRNSSSAKVEGRRSALHPDGPDWAGLSHPHV